jgi:hypothetical protein
VAADDARRGARSVNENPIEGPAVPERFRSARIPDDHLRGALEASEVLSDEPRALGVDIHCSEVRTLAQELEQMAGRPAGSRARIQHAQARGGAEQWRCELRAGILNRHQTLAEPRQAVNA